MSSRSELATLGVESTPLLDHPVDIERHEHHRRPGDASGVRGADVRVDRLDDLAHRSLRLGLHRKLASGCRLLAEGKRRRQIAQTLLMQLPLDPAELVE